MIKIAKSLICLILLSGCVSTAVKREFSSNKEVTAYKRAEWIAYANNKSGSPVMFDPYQVKYSNPNNFTVPISLPIRGDRDNYGNWIWEFNCGSLNGRMVSTLGGTPRNDIREYNDTSLAGLIRSKLCGIKMKGETYKFLSVGAKNIEVYYAQTGIQQHSQMPETYKIDLAYKKVKENFIFSKIEVDCRRDQYKFENETVWKSYARRSPLDILKLRVCNSPQLKPYLLVKYSNEIRASAVTPIAKNELRSSVDLNKSTQVITDSPSLKCRRIGLKPGSEDFDLCVQTMAQ